MPVLEVLKEAILSERRAAMFYQKAAEQAGDPGVRSVFSTMADEEQEHVRLLARQYTAWTRDGRFVEMALEEPVPLTTDNIVTSVVQGGLQAAGFEAAAIGAAMALEEQAIRLYSERAAAARDEQERAMYAWLATWERGHLQFLARMDDAVRESVWQDNNFWPFD